MNTKVSHITLRPKTIIIPERFRIEYGDLNDLGKSLEEKGQLQTILLHKESDGSFELIAGARRLLSLIQKEVESVECLFKEGLTPVEKRELEIEENIKRKDFTFVEEVKWKEELKKLYETKHPPGIFSTGSRSGAVSAVAKRLGESDSNVDRDIELAEGLRQFPELTKEKNKAAAYKKLKQMEAQLMHEILADRKKDINPNFTLIHGDSCIEIEKIKDGSVDLIITDPAWGVDNDTSQMLSDSDETFDDSVETAFSTLRRITPHLFRVAAIQSHMYMFFATKFYTQVFAILSQAGWEIEPIPLIWIKTTGNNIYPYKKFTPKYETIFFCNKGGRYLSYPSDATFGPIPVPQDKIHPNQKPIKLIKIFIELSSVPGEVVFDPFAGSGVVGKAALELGRKAILCEKDLTFYNKIKLMEVENVKKD